MLGALADHCILAHFVHKWFRIFAINKTACRPAVLAKVMMLISCLVSAELCSSSCMSRTQPLAVQYLTHLVNLLMQQDGSACQ